MKFLDITGLKQVISKLQEWVTNKLDTKVDKDALDNKLLNYKVKGRQYKNIIGRSIPIENIGGPDVYWFMNHLPIRISIGKPRSDRLRSIYDAILRRESGYEIIFKFIPCFRTHTENSELNVFDTVHISSRDHILYSRYCLVFLEILEIFGGGVPIGVSLYSVTYTEYSFTIVFSVRLDYADNTPLPPPSSFTSKTLCYKKNGLSFQKVYTPNYVISGDSVQSGKPQRIMLNKIYGGNITKRLHKRTIFMARRHSVGRKTLDPATGKLIKIRTAPRFTWVRSSNKNFSVSPALDKGYYKVYVGWNRVKHYIGDIVVTANKWKIENGKRKIDIYKIKGV